jgi:SAM-dependent methyltransferase
MHRRGYVAWRDRLESSGRSLRGLRVLEVGTGDRAPLALQFAADGASVTALDIRPVRLGRRRPEMWWELLRREGSREAGRTAFIDLIHTFRYWRRLSELVGTRLPYDAVRIVEGDAARLPFADDSFDVVVSSAVWEHLPDVPAATREVARVLTPDGIAVIQVALYPSLRGGHHADWHDLGERPRTILPWGHLRTPPQTPPVYLNSWREEQYRATLSEAFRVREWQEGPLEGAEYLAPEARAALPAWTERDLLLPWVTAWLEPFACGSDLIEDKG